MHHRHRLVPNVAGRAYILSAVVLAGFIVFLVLTLASGMWRAPFLAMPRAVLAYVRTMFATQPAVAWGGAAVAAVFIGVSALWARWRVNKLEKCVGEPKEGVTVVTGVLLLLGDVTKGVVVTIIEAITD